MPGITIPLEQMNKQISLTPAVGMMDIYQSTGLLQLDLYNLSSQTIFFPPDFGTRIFMRDGTAWHLLENGSQHADHGYELPPRSPYNVGFVVNAMPVSPAASGRKIIRIVVIGRIAGTAQAVGAYADVEIDPDQRP